MIKKALIVLILIICSSIINGQTISVCNNALPVCTQAATSFSASTNTSAPSGPDYGCLMMQPNPAWYIFQVDSAGDLTYSMSSIPSVDIDFVCWGPFTNAASMCSQLTAGNIVDCSYSQSSIETCQVNGATTGDYYVLLITNFTSAACDISFSQTSGNASTNCCVGGNSGLNNSISICEESPAFIMENQLNGVPDTGGVWYNSAWIPQGSNNFNPSTGSSGVYSYISQSYSVPGATVSCASDTSFLTINVNSTPILNFPTLNDICSDNAAINLVGATPTGGAYSGPGVSANVFTPNISVLGSNTITYSYSDVNGCSDDITEDITVKLSPFTSITTTDVTCNGFNDGSATITILGGTPNYTTYWVDMNGMPVSPNALTAGTFSYAIKDMNNCSYSDSVIIYEPGLFTASSYTTNVSCRGGDGTVSISASGGNTPYYYSIDGGFTFDTIGFSFSVLLDSLVVGNYNVVVKDSFCLTNNESVEVKIFPNIINSVTIINESCCGDDGQIIVFADNSTSIIKYSLNSFLSWQDSSEFVGLYRGDYLLHVEDTNGCLDSIEVYVGVDSVPNINMMTQATDIICNGDVNGTFKVYYPDICYDYVLWRYTLFSPQLVIDTGFYFNELMKGYYGVVATSKSGTCIDSSMVRYVDEPTKIVYDKPISSAVYCMNNGLCNGSVMFGVLPSGGVPPYNYYVNEIYTNILVGTIPIDSAFLSLCPGEYNVQVFDANACFSLDTVLVSDSSLYIDSMLVVNSSCYSSDNGLITIFAHGGLGSYSYLWSNGDVSQTADSLSVNTYNVIVSDTLGCFTLDSATNYQPDTLLFKIIESGKVPETCMGASYDGQIFLEITGGTAPYSYTWVGNSGVNGLGIGDTLIHLTYDTITITVTDVNGCFSSPAWGTIDVTIVDALDANNPLSLDSVLVGNSPMCFEGAVGTLEIDISQGVSPYWCSIDNGVTKYLSNTFTNLLAKSYSVVIYDAFGCTDSAKIVLSEYAELLVNIDSVKHVSCFNGQDGAIAISASGGEGNHSVLWNPNLDTTALITALSASSYSFLLTDSLGCKVTDTVVLNHLTDPIQVTDLQIINTTCFDGSDGSANIQIIGGMPFQNGDYVTSWMDALNDTVSFKMMAINLNAGVYLVTVTDSLSCGPFVDSIIIGQPKQFYLEVMNINNNLCFGGDDGEIIVNTFGGTTPYFSYSIADSLNGVLSEFSAVYSGLIANNYELWATDAVGCNSDSLFDVKLGEPGEIIIQSSVTYLSCFDSNDGKIELSLFSGTSPYFYELFDGVILFGSGIVSQASSFILCNLYAANYNLHIKDYNHCNVDTQIIVKQPEKVVAKFVVNDNLGTESFTTSFENLSLGSDNFSWKYDDGISRMTAFENQVVHTFVSQGKYEVMLIAKNSNLPNSCNDTALVIVDVEGFDLFNSFSPNSDGINDVFHFNEWMLIDLEVEIFNRWGQQVYHWNGMNGYWDGVGLNGEKLPEGVYFYNMQATNAEDYSFQKKGSVTLFR